MEPQETMDYKRIAEAIEYIRNNFKEQPSLEDIAEKAFVSPYHFQRMFSKWAGTSPKKFLQYISLEYAKQLLKDGGATLFDAAYETGLSGTSRLHDLFITIEGMTPAEYKNGGRNLAIHYSFAESPFGNIIVASTGKGVCYLAFEDDETKAFEDLKARFPAAHFIRKLDLLQQHALFIFQHDWSKLAHIKLHLHGTEFQLKVWEALLKIPSGKLSTYGSIANSIHLPNASRAVGTAIGSNPVAYLIPCHRVIRGSGAIGGYAWGPTRKTAMLGWEAAQVHKNNDTAT